MTPGEVVWDNEVRGFGAGGAPGHGVLG